MTQRFTEVSISTVKECYLNHEISDHDAAALDDESRELAGGQSFSGDENFMVTWRICQNVAEVTIDGMSRSIQKTNIRITCQLAPLSGQICVACNESELILMLASSYSVHVITLATAAMEFGMGMEIRSSHSYPVDTESPIMQCSALATEDFGIVFSLVNNNGQLLAATIQNDVYEQCELKQSSLISTIWNRVRRSMVSGVDNSSNIVSSAISEEHPSIYALTKDFQLQQWAIGTWECLSSYNLTAYVSPAHYIHGQMVRFFSHHPNSLLGVHFTDGTKQSKVMLLSVSGVSGQLGDCSLVADCSENTVLSYQVVSDLLFILWRDIVDKYQLVHVPMYTSELSFVSCKLKSTALRLVSVEPSEDPRQVFTEQIFHINQLCVPALLKAIHMLDPVAAGGLLTDQMEYSVEELKKMTWNAISNEVRDAVSTEEVTDVEYRDLQISVWNKFYEDLAHHQEDMMQPLGIVDGGTELPLALVRKSCVSYMRPCEAFEQQILFPDEPLDNAAAVNQDVVTIMKSLALLYKYVEGFDEHIYSCILQGESIEDAISQVVQAITTRPDHSVLKAKFSGHTQNTHMLRDGISVFLHFLDVVNQLPKDMASLTADTSMESNPFYQMSVTGRNIVCSSVRDMVAARYRLCCNLVLYLEYLSQLSEEINRSEELRVSMEELSGTCHALMRAYAVLMWLCGLNPSTGLKQEFSKEMVEALKYANSDCMESMLLSAGDRESSLLTNFLSDIGGMRVKALLTVSPEQCNYYEYLNLLLVATSQALWPETTDTIFPEYLLASNEVVYLQSYCRLLDGHSKSSASSRMFLLGQTYLVQGVAVKAQACFIMALSAISDGDADDMDDEQTRQQQIQFCYKTMNMLEELSFSEQVIQMAQETLKFSDTEQPTLFTKLFRHHLELQQYDESFQCILENQDRDRKMDCLSQFVSALCENGELKNLISYPYKDMTSQEDLRPAVVSILLRKARSADLTTKNYYDLLYAFHVYNNDLLSAANVMHECGERIRCELSGSTALQKRAKCYLACIHSLHCVQPKSAWISPSSLSQRTYKGGSKSPKRTSHGRDKLRSSAPIKIHTLADIEKEYMLVNMALRLASNGCQHITGCTYLDATELVGHLCNTGMYDEAIQVCAAYNLPLSSIFDSLTFRCLRMSKEKENDRLSEVSEESKRWLTYNELPSETTYSSACDQAWRILRYYLETHELVSTKYHKTVANKLLANSTSLPEWFTASYKRRNVAELLRVYLQHDMIEEAVNLSTDYLQAMTSHTYESFGLEGPLTATMKSAAIGVPYTSVDLLLNLLSEHQQDPYYDNLYQKLGAAVTQYTEELEEKSRDAERLMSTAGY